MPLPRACHFILPRGSWPINPSICLAARSNMPDLVLLSTLATGAVKACLETLRPRDTSERSTGEPAEPAATAEAAAAAAKALASSDHTLSPPAPATKRARCGERAPTAVSGADGVCAGGNTSPAEDTKASLHSKGGVTTAEFPGAAAVAATMAAAGASSSSNSCAGKTAAAALSPNRLASVSKTGGAAVSLPAQVPPQGPRGLSWKEKQREKAQAAAEKGAGKGKGKGGGGSSRKKKGRDFDHARWRKRSIAVQLMYEGENYAGFCSQVRACDACPFNSVPIRGVAALHSITATTLAPAQSVMERCRPISSATKFE